MGAKKLFEGKFITVTHDGKYERAHLMPSVQVVPFTKDGKVLMIKEKRLIEGQSRWKFVSGFLDKPHLSPEETAQEELMEEANVRAGRLEKYHYHEGKHSFIIPITYYLAYDLEDESKPNPDGDVIEDVRAFSIEELHQRALEGEFDFLHEHSMIMRLYRDLKAGRLKTQ